METSGKRFWEQITPNRATVSTLKRILFSGKTQYQSVEIMETGSFGLTLVLDGKTQSASIDEFVYHETLVQPAMILHPHPEVVFIAGGGEGATVREVLSHHSIGRVVMVDIDSQVVELCKKYMPDFSRGAYDDPRLELRFQDALAYLHQTEESYDVVIIDIPDPLEGGPAYRLYTQEFYQLLKRRLKPQGIVVVQAGPTAVTESQCFSAINKTLSTVFPRVFGYHTYMASFSSTWGFAMATLGLDPTRLSIQEIDQRLAQRVKNPRRFYDGTTHQGLFALPKHLRDSLARESRIITEGAPLFVV